MTFEREKDFFFLFMQVKFKNPNWVLAREKKMTNFYILCDIIRLTKSD